MNADRKRTTDGVYEAAESFAGSTLADRPVSGRLDRPSWDAAFEFFGANGVIGSLRGEGGLSGIHIIKTFEALGRGGADRGLLFALGAHLFGCVIPIARFGSDDQAAAWLPRLIQGETVAALAMTEAGSGSTVSELKTEAIAADGGYVLSGHKRLVTNAPDAGLFLAFAREAGASGPFSLTAFLVPGDTPGLSVEHSGEANALKGAPMGVVTFDECRLPADAVLHRPRAGIAVFGTCMQWERSCILAGFLGAAARDLATCVEWARSRQSGQSAISDHQAVSHRLARMKVRIEQARSSIYQAVSDLDQGTATMSSAAIAKVVASESIVSNAMDAMRLAAGDGWLNELGLARGLNDSIGTLTASGTNDIQLELIARELLSGARGSR